jgi:tRNA-specific adenosine deaminase 3
MFNHSSSPNVSYTLKSTQEAIWYTTTRMIAENEELNIFYGHKLWFDDVAASQQNINLSLEEEDLALPIFGDDFNGVSHQSSLDVKWSQLVVSYSSGRDDDIVNEEDLPFTRIRTIPMEPPEESPDDIMTGMLSSLCGCHPA